MFSHAAIILQFLSDKSHEFSRTRKTELTVATDLLPLACVCPVLCSRGLVCFAHEDSTRLAREVGTLQVERNRFVHLLPPRRAEEQGLGLSESWVWGLTCQLHDFSQAHVLWASASFLMNLQICSIPKYPYFGDRTKWQASEPLTG